MRPGKAVALFAWVALLASSSPGRGTEFGAEEDLSRDAPQRRGGPGGTEGGRIFKDRITPHWFAEDTRFWYRNDLAGGAKEFILVVADRGTREPAFDHVRLATSLSEATGAEIEADRLPFDDIAYVDDGRARVPGRRRDLEVYAHLI